MATTRAMQEIRMEMYLKGVSTDHKPRFEAIKQAYDSEYPGIREAALLAHRLTVEWPLKKSEAKWKTAAFEKEKEILAVRKDCEQIGLGNLRCKVLSDFIQREMANFQNDVYQDRECPAYEKEGYINQMKSFLHLLGNVQKIFNKSMGYLYGYGSNLIEVLEKDQEMRLTTGWIPLYGCTDQQSLSSLLYPETTTSPQQEENKVSSSSVDSDPTTPETLASQQPPNKGKKPAPRGPLTGTHKTDKLP